MNLHRRNMSRMISLALAEAERQALPELALNGMRIVNTILLARTSAPHRVAEVARRLGTLPKRTKPSVNEPLIVSHWEKFRSRADRESGVAPSVQAIRISSFLTATSLLVYENSIICAGAQRLATAERAFGVGVFVIGGALAEPLEVQDVQLQVLVAFKKFASRIDVAEFAQNHALFTQYRPTRMGGAIVDLSRFVERRTDKDKVTAIVFASGKCLLMGSTYAQLLAVYYHINALLVAYFREASAGSDEDEPGDVDMDEVSLTNGVDALDLE